MCQITIYNQLEVLSTRLVQHPGLDDGPTLFGITWIRIRERTRYGYARQIRSKWVEEIHGGEHIDGALWFFK